MASRENIALDLLEKPSSSESDFEEDELDSSIKVKKKKGIENMKLSKSSNSVQPLSYERKNSTPLLSPAENYNAKDAFKDMIDVVVDPAARRASPDLDIVISLHQAAREGDVAAIKRFFSFPRGKSKVNQLDEEKLSPLHYAARYNHMDTIEVLLDHGANVNIVGDDGLMPIHYAARYHKKRKARGSSARSTDDLSGDESDSMSVIKYLCGSGAKINGVDNYGMTPLHYASMRGNEVAARDLLSFDSVAVEAEDKQKLTPLHYASLYGYLEIVKLLVEAGTNLRAMDQELNTPLHLAAEEGRLAIAEFLLLAADDRGGWPAITQMVSDKDDENNIPLHRAVENGHTEIVKLLLVKGSNVNAHRKNFIFPLHQAATNGNLDIAILLVQNKARVDCVNIHQSTPLHKAAAFNHTPVIQYLLDKGAKLEAQDRDGFTPLLWAACYGHADAVEKLLSMGADVTAKDKCEKTALFIAAEENHTKVADVLLAHEEAQYIVDYSDKYDNSPLHAAAADGNLSIIKVLLNNGSDISNKNEEGKNALHLAAENGRTKTCAFLINRSPVIIGDEDEESNTSLHLAAINGHYRVIKLLLNAGSDIEALNSNLWTALDCAAANGHLKSVKVLLEEDSPIDPTDRNKTTPLHLAAKEGYASVVKLLLDSDADISRRDARGRNCLDISIAYGKKEVALTIINHSKWMDALKNERLNSHGLRETPLRELIKKMPEVAEEVFKKCIKTNGYPNDHYHLKVTFNYEFLDDAFTCYNYEDADKLSLPEIYDENDRVLQTANLYSNKEMDLKMNHPLMIMARTKRQGLLGHPLCTSLLEYKWKLFGRYVFYANLLVYALFLIMLTGYALYETDPYSIKKIEQNLAAQNANRTADAKFKYEEPSFVKIGRNGIICLVAFHILREIFQIYNRRWHYLNLENLMEWTIYTTAIIYVMHLGEGTWRTKLQWQIGALSVFLAWADLVMITRKFPFFGIYVVMFFDIMKTFSKFFVIFFLFIIAFALSFYLLLHDSIEFRQMPQALLKTSVMMIGEFEFDSVFSVPYATHQLNYPNFTLILFSIFIIVMSIILMNLLVGLAVDDIKAVAEQAALQRLAMQADLVLSVEGYLPKILRRHFTRREKSVYPNRRYKFKILTYLLMNSTEYLDSVANALTYKEEMKFDQLRNQQEEMLVGMKHLKDSIRQLNKQTRRLQSMLMTVVQNSNLNWEDEDEFSS